MATRQEFEVKTSDLVEPTKIQTLKQSGWQYVGAAFTETKNGKQAVSLTRLLAMITFGMLMWKWGFGTEVPDSLMWAFGGLIGGKTFESLAAIIRHRKGR